MAQRNVLIMISPASAGRTAGIARFARERGWQVFTQERLGFRPLVWDGDGALVTIRSDKATIDAVRALRRRGIPVIDLTCARPDIAVPRVCCDHEAIGRLAAVHFAEHHFLHTAWLSLGWSRVHALRHGGFAGECVRLGMEKPSKWVFFDEVPARKAVKWDKFVLWMKRHLAEARKPLAVFSYDEQDAVRLESVCRENGISIPDDVAILSVGNDPLLCETQPVPLSSIDQNLEENAYRAAELLERLMSGGKAPARPVLVPPAGVVARLSTDTLAVEDPDLRHALLYIDRNLGKSFGSGQIADAIGVPRYRLDRLFAAVLGHSVGEEIRNRRLIRVKRRLKETDDPIGRIASECGFCGAAHLTNFFKAATGMPPKEFRRDGLAL